MSLYLFILSLFFVNVLGQMYEDKRCRCICPTPAAVFNSSMTKAMKYFNENVPPNKCNCIALVVPRIRNEIKGNEQQYCRKCECKYQTRNTTIIMVVVIMVLWVLMMLSGYMGFLMCLDPLINKRKLKMYKERGTDEAQNLLLQGDDGED